MSDRIKKALGALRDGLPDFRDLHVYGGLALFAVAGFQGFGWIAPAVAGAALFYLGVWRFG